MPDFIIDPPIKLPKTQSKVDEDAKDKSLMSGKKPQSIEITEAIKNPLSIAYYVSGHGFGHATRVCQVINALLAHNSDDTISEITIVSQAPSKVFKTLLESEHKSRLKHRHADIDPHVVQPQPYAVDAHETTRNLHKFVDEMDDKVKQEVEWLKQHDFDVVLCDAPFMPCYAASQAGILTIIISNFTFAEVYSFFVGDLERQGRTDEAKELNELVDKLVFYYTHADVLLRMPGFLPNPAFQKVPLPSSQWIDDSLYLKHEILQLIDRRDVSATEDVVPRESKANLNFDRRIIDTPLTCRPPHISKDVDAKHAYLKSMGVPEHDYEKPLLLITFPDKYLFEKKGAKLSMVLPSDWIGITCGIALDDPLRDNLIDDLYAAPPDCHVPDLMLCASVVIGKLGYGTISESISCNTPFVYVPRSAFIEEFGLKRLVETFPNYGKRVVHGEEGDVQLPAKCLPIPKEDFIEGNWSKFVTQAYSMGDKQYTGGASVKKNRVVEDGGPQYEGVAGTVDAGEFIAAQVLACWAKWTACKMTK